MGHVSNKPNQQLHFMPFSATVRNISYLFTARGRGQKRLQISFKRFSQLTQSLDAPLP